MTIGKITASQQDTVFVKVRAEDGTFMETHNGTTEINYNISNSVGQQFTAAKWFGRIKIKIGNAMAETKVRFSVFDSPSKTKVHFENESKFDTSGVAVLHIAFDPLPAGSYYYELVLLSGSVSVSVVTDSTIHKAYKEGAATTDWDIKSKVMHVADAEEERAVAVVGDPVDSGVTAVSSGSSFGSIMTGVVERNISREGDSLANGGKILTGCWFVEIDD
jgi:hypothetical protein